jgi:hypothetical protein
MTTTWLLSILVPGLTELITKKVMAAARSLGVFESQYARSLSSFSMSFINPFFTMGNICRVAFICYGNLRQNFGLRMTETKICDHEMYNSYLALALFFTMFKEPSETGAAKARIALC